MHEGDQSKRDHIPQDELGASDRRDPDARECPIDLLPDDRQKRQNGADQSDDQPHDRRSEAVDESDLNAIELPRVDLDRSTFAQVHRCVGKPHLDGGGNLRIRFVERQIDRPLCAGGNAHRKVSVVKAGELVGDSDDGLIACFEQKLFRICVLQTAWIKDGHRERIIFSKALQNRRGEVGCVFVNERDPHISDIAGERIPEQQHCNRR